MAFVSRLLLLAGAGSLAASVLLPWVTITGRLGVSLGVLGAHLSATVKTVHGTDTSLLPVILAVAAVVAVLGVAGVARPVLLGLGVLVTAGGGALLYYLANIIEIKTRDGGAIEQALSQALLSSSPGPGAPLIVASGIVILLGALALR